ncbi:MAG: DUF4468 domain-containing protein [Bacteroidota bacterium]|nr:DUF4468 domain-containing protein [Bacteroidota bacterium]
MKFILTIFATFLLTVNANAQKETPNLPIDTITKMITYTEVVNVDTSLSKQELYSRAREWFAKVYNSSQNVIQMDDKESGKIVGKALTQVYHKALGSNYPSGYINYTISIYLKDGRYKYEISNFHHTGQLVSAGRIDDYGPCEEMIKTKKKTMGMSYQKTFNYYLLQLDTKTNSLIEDLKASMSSTALNNKKNDW